MKPVDQTVFGAPHGNCLFAAVASILEVPLEAFPPFGGSAAHWWDELLDAIRPHGYTAMYYPNGIDGYPAIAPKGYHVASGQSARGFFHATVALDGTVVHDPHPDRTGVAAIRAFYLMLPLAGVQRETPDKPDESPPPTMDVTT